MKSALVHSSITTLMQQMATLTSRREEKELAHSLLEMSLQFMSISDIALYGVRRQHEQEQIRHEAALPDDPELSQHWYSAEPALTQLIRDAIDDNRPRHINQCFWQCIRKRNEVVALLALRCDSLSEHDMAFLAGMVRIHENHLRLLYDAERDMLTGLRNRRTFDAKLFELLEKRSGNETLAVMDIDFFKQVNDRYGHIMGDEVLLLLARRMEEVLGEDVLLYRYGGEEFAIILPDHPAAAQNRLEALRCHIAGYELPQIGQITVSIGHVRIHEQSLPANLIEEADKALYFAKEHGRNCVCDHAVLQQQGLISPRISHHGDIELF